MSVCSKITKTIGVGAIGLVGYDCLKMGHRKAVEETVNTETEGFTDMFIHHQASDSPSFVTSGIQKWARNFVMDSKIHATYLKIKNYVVCTVEEFLKSSEFLALGAVAAAAATKIPVLGKIPSFVGKIAAGLLALQGLKVIFHDGFGIGKRKEI